MKFLVLLLATFAAPGFLAGAAAEPVAVRRPSPPTVAARSDNETVGILGMYDAPPFTISLGTMLSRIGSDDIDFIAFDPDVPKDQDDSVCQRGVVLLGTVRTSITEPLPDSTLTPPHRIRMSPASDLR